MSAGDGLARLHKALADHGTPARGTAAKCPAHDDRQASLSLSQGRTGALLRCHAGCATDEVLEALGISAADLFDEPRQRGNGRAYEVAATYAYTDEHGEPLFYAERRIPKDFRQYRVVNGRKVWNLRGARLVLYRLPAVIEAVRNGDPVWVCEGEKDVHALEAAGVVATTSPMGAGKWRDEYAGALRGARVVIVADRDDAGRAHARQVAASLAGVAATVRIVEPAEGKDAADHLAAGRGLEAFAEPACPDGAGLLDDLCEWLTGYVSFPSSHSAVAVTLWAAHTHLAACFDSTPRLALLSPEKQCGKTRVLELLELTCAGAETLSDASAAYLFRRIGAEDAGPVTVLIDECDALWKRGSSDDTAEALRSVINAGHRKGATVGRCEMNGRAAVPTRYPVYAPAALAGIGRLPGTILDRSVTIGMRRRALAEKVRPYRERVTRPEGGELRGRLADWAAAVARQVGDPWPDMPDGITDRLADVWEPLLMVADLAGLHWPELARQACIALARGSQDDAATAGVRLLADIRLAWVAATSATSATPLASHVADVALVADGVPTERLLQQLRSLDESPWGDWYGKPLDPRGLAKLLRPYGIRPAQIRMGDLNVRGYRRADFADAWKRYLPGEYCTRCGEALDPALVKAGLTDHGETDVTTQHNRGTR